MSIRGVYFQAEIQSQPITWIVPHQFCPIVYRICLLFMHCLSLSPLQIPSTVDLRIMLTFLEFYRTLLGFVNFKLYHSVGIRYPPQVRRSTETNRINLMFNYLAAETNGSHFYRRK